MKNEITIATANQIITVNVIKQKDSKLGIEFMGIFPKARTQFTTRIEGRLYSGSVLVVKNNKAILQINDSAIAWLQCAEVNHGA